MAKILKNQGSYKILSITTGLQGENHLELIELAGRTAYQSREKITNESATKFVGILRKSGHESVLEHSAITVEFNNLSRGFTHELVRHRLAAFTQESTRYVDESDFLVVIPPDKDPDEKLVSLNFGNSKDIKVSFQDWINLNEQMYRGLRKAGWIAQDARQTLPIGIKAQIVITANFREWRHIFKLRCSPDAHWEIRQVMVDLLDDLQERVPVIFGDFQISSDKKSAKII